MATNKAVIILEGVDKTRGAFGSASKSFDRLGSQVRGFATGFGVVGGAAGLVAAAFGAVVKSSIDAMDKMSKMAQQTGVTVESLSALNYAAGLAGVEQDELGQALVKLAKNMGDAAIGTGEAAKAFDALGIKVKDSSGALKNSDTVLLEIAQKFAGLKDGAGKTALAVGLFGRAGAKLIPLLNAGAGGIEQLRAEAKRLGIVLDTETSKAAEEFNDNLSRISAMARGAAITISGPLIKSLAALSTEFINAKKNGEGTLSLLERMANMAPTVPQFLRGHSTLRLFGLAQESGAARAGLDKANARERARFDSAALLNAAPLKDAPLLSKPGGAGGGGKGAAKDPLAEARRYLETLQKQAEKLDQLTHVEEALLDIRTGRIGMVSPALEKEILQTARLIDLRDAETDGLKASADAADKAATEAGKLYDESIRFMQELATPAEKLASELERIGKLGENNPLINDEMLARASTQAWADYIATIDAGTAAVSKFDEFSRQAAENIQDSIGSGLFDIMQGNYKNIGDSFKQMVDRMVAEALAADISRKLFGDLVAGGTGKGMAGDLLGSVGKLFGGAGGATPTTGDFARLDRGQAAGGSGGGDWLAIAASWFSKLASFDVGTDFVPQDMVARIHKGERIVPAAQNRPGLGGVVQQSITFVNPGPVDRTSQAKLAAAALSGARRGQRVL